MFDLNEQLNAWRQSFAQAEALRSADLNELEQHVRDAVADLTVKGLTPEEAFAVAIRRVGDPRPLVAEFKKVNGNHIWAQRAFWMIVGYLTLQSVTSATGAVAQFGQLIAASTGAGTIVLVATSIGVTISCWLAILWGLARAASDAHGGPLARLARTRRWALIALAAIVPIFATFVREWSYISLTKFMSLDAIYPVRKFGALSTLLLTVALFVLLIATADYLRRSAPEATA